MTPAQQIDHLTMMLALALSTSNNQAVFSKVAVNEFMQTWETHPRIVSFCLKDNNLAMTAHYKEEATAVKEWLESTKPTH